MILTTSPLNIMDAIKLSEKLIACPSITPVDEGALDVLQEALEQLEFKCERFIFEQEGYEKVDNLYARYGDQSPNICFAGHTDVVPPGNEGDWQFGPFVPKIADGKLYGRGASDMKCAIACFVEAAAYIIENKDFKGSISFLITGDEEGVSVNGTKKLLKAIYDKGEKIDACIVGEPTSVEEIGDMVKIGRRGSITFNLQIKGTQGHVAYAFLAKNPISYLTNILYALNSHNLDNGTKYFPPSNLEIVNLHVGNSADNVIPGSAQAVFNIRFNDLHSSDSLVKWINSICHSVCGSEQIEYSLNYRASAEPFITEPGKLSEIVSSAIKDVTGLTTELSTTGGTSDARFIKDYCSVIELGMLNKTAHKVDEHVAVDDIKTLTEIYKKVLEQFFINE